MVTALFATTSCASPPAGDSLTEVPCPKRPSQRLELSFGANVKAGLAADERKGLADALTQNALGSNPSPFTVSLVVNGGAALCLDLTSWSGSEILKSSELPAAIGKQLNRLDDWIRDLVARAPLPQTHAPVARSCKGTLTVRFKAGESELSGDAQRRLTVWYHDCRIASCVIRISGFASPEGEKGLNETLAEARADSVNTFLVELRGSAGDRIVSVEGRGIDRSHDRSKQAKRRATVTCTTEGTR